MASAKLPPPLPPRPFVPEPFLPAKSEPPVNRTANTPRDGTVPVYDPDPRDGMIRELQQELALLRDELEQRPPTDPPPTRPSVRVRRAAIAKVLGKAAGLLVLAPFVGAAVARKWPEYADLVDLVLQLVGLR